MGLYIVVVIYLCANYILYMDKKIVEIHTCIFKTSVILFNFYTKKIYIPSIHEIVWKMDNNFNKLIFIIVCVLLFCLTLLEYNSKTTIKVPDGLVRLVNYINNSVTNISQKKTFLDGKRIFIYLKY